MSCRLSPIKCRSLRQGMRAAVMLSDHPEKWICIHPSTHAARAENTPSELSLIIIVVGICIGLLPFP